MLVYKLQKIILQKISLQNFEHVIFDSNYLSDSNYLNRNS